MYGIVTYEANYLVHYGIKGQKWGLRRFQNEDGTLTQEGRERYHADSFEKREAKKTQKSYERSLSKLNKLDAKADIRKQKDKALMYADKSRRALKTGAAGLAATAGILAMPFKDIERVSHPHKNVKVVQIMSGEQIKTGLAALTGLFSVGALTKSLVNNMQSKHYNRRTSVHGHEKAVAKREAQYAKMLKKFSNTPYKDVLERHKYNENNNITLDDLIKFSSKDIADLR